MRVAFIAHEEKKDDMINFAKSYEAMFGQHTLYATNKIGVRIMDETDLKVRSFQASEAGEIIDMVIFFRDPEKMKDSVSDIETFTELCEGYSVELAEKATFIKF